MYTIFADGQIIHSPALDRPTALVFGAKLTQQANMADSFVFTIYPNNPAAATIHKLTTIIEVYQDDSLLFRGRPIQSKEGWNKETTYTCEGGFAYFNDTILRPYEFAGTVREYLQSLVTQHNSQVPAEKQFTLRTVTVTDPNDYIVRSNSDYTTTMSEIQDKLIGNLGGYLVPEYTGGQWYLDYLATSIEATGQTITLAKNLLDFIREQNAENIATALIPLGAVDENTGERITIKSVNDGLDYIVDAAAAAQYGLIFTTETWDDVTVPANLLTKAQERLTDYTTLIPTIQLTAVDLSITDQAIDPIRLLDNVTVQDDQHTASGSYIVTARTYDLSDPAADQITFGGALPTISGIATKTASEIQEIPAKVLTNASERARAILDSATDGAIQILYNDDGVAYEMRINNSQNPETATAWWRYNAGGWAYTDDGGETYTVAALMDGTMYASLIKAGILSDDNGVFSINMATGSATFNDISITGGSIDITTQSQTQDKIILSYNDWITKLAPIGLQLDNSSTSRRISVQAGGIFGSEATGTKNTWTLQQSTNGGALYIRNASAGSATTIYPNSAGYGEISNYDPSGNLTGQLTVTSSGYGTLYLKDGTRNRVILNDGNLYFYGSDGTTLSTYGPTNASIKDTAGTSRVSISGVSNSVFAYNSDGSEAWRIMNAGGAYSGLLLRQNNGTLRVALNDYGLKFCDVNGTEIATINPVVVSTW